MSVYQSACQSVCLFCCLSLCRPRLQYHLNEILNIRPAFAYSHEILKQEEQKREMMIESERKRERELRGGAVVTDAL